METHEILLISLVIGTLVADVRIRLRLAPWRRHLSDKAASQSAVLITGETETDLQSRVALTSNQ
jgi:hypothetical protein